MSDAKPYVREPARTTWYLSHRRYMQHMAQELTSVFVGVYALLLLWGIRALAAGEEAWRVFLADLASPLSLSLHWLILGGTLYHTVSWFAVTPKAMPVQFGEHFVPGGLIAGAHYLVWAAVSLFILYFAGAI
jgi:fumarate reductase subunit C